MNTHAENRQDDTETMHAASREIKHLLEVNAVMLEALEKISERDPEAALCREFREICGCQGCIARRAIKLAKGEQS